MEKGRSFEEWQWALLICFENARRLWNARCVGLRPRVTLSTMKGYQAPLSTFLSCVYRASHVSPLTTKAPELLGLTVESLTNCSAPSIFTPQKSTPSQGRQISLPCPKPLLFLLPHPQFALTLPETPFSDPTTSLRTQLPILSCPLLPGLHNKARAALWFNYDSNHISSYCCKTLNGSLFYTSKCTGALVLNSLPSLTLLAGHVGTYSPASLPAWTTTIPPSYTNVALDKLLHFSVPLFQPRTVETIKWANKHEAVRTKLGKHLILSECSSLSLSFVLLLLITNPALQQTTSCSTNMALFKESMQTSGLTALPCSLYLVQTKSWWSVQPFNLLSTLSYVP